MAIPRSVFGIQLCHATATRAFFERVFAANIHDHLNVIGLVDVQLFTHGPQKLVLTGRNDAVLKDHLNDVSVILDRGKVSVVQDNAALFRYDVGAAGVVNEDDERSGVQ